MKDVATVEFASTGNPKALIYIIHYKFYKRGPFGANGA